MTLKYILTLKTLWQGNFHIINSEDPIYVLENNIPIDQNYYRENQISKVISWNLEVASFYPFIFSILVILVLGG
ncbi:hypothetical protein YC2023_113773 [Brassica napus]